MGAEEMALLRVQQSSQKKSSIFGNMGSIRVRARKLMCSIGHSGKFYYLKPYSCLMEQVCQVCGTRSLEENHKWQGWHKLVPNLCEHVRFCETCGEEQYELIHNWDWSYTAPGSCEQHQHCSVCNQWNKDANAETREKHKWGREQTSLYGDEQQVTCVRCGETRSIDSELRRELDNDKISEVMKLADPTQRQNVASTLLETFTYWSQRKKDE